MEATVIGIEYDPNRTSNIALIQYEDGEKAYILAPVGLKDGDKVVSGENVDIKPGNCLPIENIPVGTLIHNIELNPGQGGKMVKAAGGEAQLMAKEGEYAHVRLPSGEMRLVRAKCRATIGTIGNTDHGNVKLGKAGRTRHMGVRPTVRGSVMNPVDHPHGGGEGKAPVGHSGPLTPWGKQALGYKTRKKNNRKNIEIAMKLIDYPDSLDDDWDLVDGQLENMKWKIKELEIKGAEAEDPTDREIDEMILEKLESE